MYTTVSHHLRRSSAGNQARKSRLYCNRRPANCSLISNLATVPLTLGLLLIGAAMPGRCRAAVVPLGTSVPAPKSSAAHVPPAVFGMMLRIAAFVLLVRSAERLQPLASIAKLDNMLTKVPWSALSARKGCIRISLDHRIAANVLLVSIRQVLNRRRRFWPPRPPD